jgi:hypothetical protein
MRLRWRKLAAFKGLFRKQGRRARALDDMADGSLSAELA